MQKKTNSKKQIPVKKITSKPKPKKILKNPNVEKVLVENFIALQKVMTNLAMKFDGLNIQISKLLELFEISAKTLAKKDIITDKRQGDPKMVDKLDTLLDQNKIIARSLTLLHESPEPMPPKQLMKQPHPPQLMRQPAPSQKPPMPLQPSPVKQMDTNGYQKSMSIKNQESPSPKPAG